MIGDDRTKGLLTRVPIERGNRVEILIDGEKVAAFEGDTLLLAILSRRTRLRRNEFDASSRAGFCLMGACQDCWVWLEGGTRSRACTTFVEAGMAVLTETPGAGGPE